MGLEKFNIAPDNKGGRPEGSTKDDKGRNLTRETEGRALTSENGDKEWWLNVISEVLGTEGIPDTTFIEKAKAIEELAAHTWTNPMTVRTQLDEHGILETDWEEYEDKFDMVEGDCRIPGNIAADIRITKASRSSSSGSSSSSSSDGGLSSLVEFSKEN